MMNLRDLKYLVTVADTGHFGKAAERCFVSQPTLSAQLKKIEDELGVLLFERHNKRVMITDIGKIIVAKARIILQECEQLRTLAHNSKDPFAGIFRLGIIPTLGPYLLPHVLKVLKKQLPKLDLIIHENKTENLLQQVRQGDLDAIIIALPVAKEGLVVEELFCEPFYVALPKNHSLSKKKKLTLQDLEKETLLLLEEGHCLREQAIEACALPPSAQRSGFQATSLETLRHVVAAGAGITLLPALSLTTVQNSHITIRPFVGPMPSRRIGMLWRESAARGECCQQISKIVHEQIAEQLSLGAKNKLKVMKKKIG